jgi:hypothetical protein
LQRGDLVRWRRKLLIVATAVVTVFLLVIAVGVAVFFSPLLTRHLEGDAFRVAMEQETSKGLHFPQARYASIRRTGALTAESDSFEAENGQKAMKSLVAHRITAKFDPWGLFLRQWRFTDVHVQSGEVEIQIYKANPEAVPHKPWFAIFLPKRVYLEKIESEQANITWRFRGERAGFFGSKLLITPNGRDFEYVATGGRFKMPIVPDLDLRRVHLLITRKLLTLYDLDLASDSHSDESIRAQRHTNTDNNEGRDYTDCAFDSRVHLWPEMNTDRLQITSIRSCREGKASIKRI